MTTINFGGWLAGMLDKKDWNQSDLARKSGLSTGQISRLLTGSRGPGKNTCTAIARAFDIPPEVVLRAAGATCREIHAEVRLFDLADHFYRMLHNPIYTGRRVFAECVYDGYCEPLVDQRTWDQVQAVNKDRAGRVGYNHPRSVRSRYILTGLLHCELCGRLMIGQVTIHPPYKERTYYRCPTSKNSFGSCAAAMIPSEIVEQRVIAVVREQILVPDILQATYRRAQEMAASGDSVRQAEMASMKGQLAAVAKSIGSIVDAIKAAGHSAALLSELEALETQQREQQERIARVEAQAPRQLPAVDNAQIMSVLGDKLATAPPAEVATVLRGFIVEIRAVRPQKGELTGSLTYRLPCTEETNYVAL